MVSIVDGYGLRPGIRPDNLLRAHSEHNSRRILHKRLSSACGAVVRRSFAAPVGALARPRLCRVIPCHATTPQTGQTRRRPSGVSTCRRAWPQTGHVRPGSLHRIAHLHGQYGLHGLGGIHGGQQFVAAGGVS